MIRAGREEEEGTVLYSSGDVQPVLVTLTRQFKAVCTDSTALLYSCSHYNLALLGLTVSQS